MKLTQNTFSDYQNYLEKNGTPQTTISRKMAALNKFQAWAQRNGLMQKEFVSQASGFTPYPEGAIFQNEKGKTRRRLLTLALAVAVILLLLFNPLSFGFLRDHFPSWLNVEQLVVAPQETTPSGSQPTQIVQVGKVGSNPWLVFYRGKINGVDGSAPTQISLDFSLYSQENDGQPLWSSKTWDLSPDESGYFSAPLGDTTRGDKEIPSGLFFNQERLYLSLTPVGGAQLTPRLVVSTADMAANSNLLRGFAPAQEAGPLTIPVINNNGVLTLAAQSPKIKAINDTFAIEGQTIVLQTPFGSDGDIILAPDGAGTVKLKLSNNTSDSLSISNANLESGALIGGWLGNDNTAPYLLRLDSGATESAKFWVDAAGNTSLAGSLKGMTELTLGDSRSQVNLSDPAHTTLPAGTTSLLGALAGANTWQDGGTFLYPTNRESMRIYDNTGTDYIDIAHDGSNVNITTSGTGQVNFDKSVHIASGLAVISDTDLQGNIKLGNETGDTITVAGRIGSDLIPALDDTYDLGSATLEWRNLYVDGVAEIDTTNITNANINTATINNLNVTSLDVGGTAQETFTIDTDDTGGNLSLIFGAANNERLTWDAANSRFNLTDDLLISNNLTVSGSTLFGTLEVADLPGGGSLGAAAATVDIYSAFNLSQDTVGQTVTLPDPTTATASRVVYLSNTGTNSFTFYGSTVQVGNTTMAVWDGNSWNLGGGGGGSLNQGTVNNSTLRWNSATLLWTENTAVLTQSNPTADASYGLSVANAGVVAAGTGYGGYFTKTGASLTNVGLYASASDATNNYAAIFANGNVGIGTTAPEDLLEVQGADATDAILTLDADRGDDAGDTWELRSVAADNDFSLVNEATEVFNLTSGGNLQIDGDLAISGGNITTAVTADSTLTVTGTLTANGVVILGDDGDTVTIDSSDWNIGATGDMTGIGNIAADGTIAFTGTTIGLGTGAGATTVSIGTGVGGNIVNIGTDNTLKDTINIGSALDDVIINGAGAGSLIDFANFDVQADGDIITAGDLDVNGDNINSDHDLTINPAGGQVLFADGDTFNIGGVTGLTYNALSDAGVTGHGLVSDNDLYVEGDVEIDGTLYVDGNLVAPPSGVSGYWQRVDGALAPANITDAVNVGATASNSAYFHAPGTNNQDAWFNLGTGNVGISTTAPAGKLQIVGTADDQQLLVKGNATQTAANLIEWQTSTNSLLGGISGDGRLGIGVTPQAGIKSYVSSTNTDPTTTVEGSHTQLFNNYTANNTWQSRANANYLYLNVGNTFTASGVQATYHGAVYMDNANQGTISNAYGNYFYTGLETGAAGTIVNMNLFDASIYAQGANTAAMTSWRAFNVQAITAAVLNGATIGTAYGLNINNISAGATANYAIVTNAGNIVFNEGGDASTDFRVEGDTSAALLFTDASADKVGIGTSAPEDLLEIQGTEGVDAILTLDADDGDDAADTWELQSVASDNDFSIVNDATEVLNLTSAGDLQIDGDLTVSGGNINGPLAASLTIATNGPASDLILSAGRDLTFDDDNLLAAVPLSLNDTGLNINLGQGIVDAINDAYDAAIGVGGTSGFWTVVDNLLFPSHSSVYDLAIGGTTTASAKFFVNHATGDASMAGTLTIGQGDTIRSQYGPLSLAYKSAPDTWTTGITLQDITGNVGINTTSPSYKLDVNGMGRFSDHLLADNELTVSDPTIMSADNTTLTVNKNLGDDDAGSWTSADVLAGVPRQSPSTVIYNGKMYVWGGNTGSVTDTMYIYNFTTSTWSAGTTGGTAREDHTAVVYNGKMYVWGGTNGGYLNTVDIYNFATGIWSTGTAGGTARKSHTAVVYNGKMYVWGGTNGGYLNTVDIYDFGDDSWTTGLAGGTARADHTAVVYNEKMYIWGGNNGGYLNTLDIYDLAKNNWTTGTAGGTARADHTAAVYNGKMYAWGGTNGSALNTLEIYDFATNSWPNLAFTNSTKDPGTAADGGGGYAWTNINNILLDDANYATNVGSMGAFVSLNPVIATNFDFTIPVTATILGVEATFKRYKSGSAGAYDRYAVLRYDSGDLGTQKDIFDYMPGSDTPRTSGNSTDLWGATLTPAIINNSSFGVSYKTALDREDYPGTVYVGNIKLTVYYGIPIVGSTARYGHNSVIYGDKMYSFGGTTAGLSTTMDIYDFGDNQNILAIQENNQNTLTFTTGSQLFLDSGRFSIMGGNVNIGTTSGYARFNVLSTLGTSPAASISAGSSFAALVVDNTVGDLFTASSSGLNRFVIKNNGNVGIGTATPSEKLDISGNATVSGNLTFYGGARTIAGTQMQSLNLGNTSTGNLSLVSGLNLYFDDTRTAAIPFSVADTALNASLGQGIIDAINDVYDAATGGSGGLWSTTNELIFPTYNWRSVAIGGSATASAKLYFDATTGDASITGTLTIGQGDTIRSQYGPLSLAYKSGTNAWTTGLTLKDLTGYVGVGTIAPSALADIGGGVATYIDGTSDLLVADDAEIDGLLAVQGASAISFAAAATYGTGVDPYYLAVGDVNNDGWADMATIDYGANTISVLINDRDGTFAAAASYPTEAFPYGIDMGDLNNDGYADIVVAPASNTGVSVYLNDGDGTFAARANYACGAGARSVSIGDVNNDGWADIATANSSDNTVSVLLSDGDGTFAANVDYAAGGSPYSVKIKDLNNDGWADMATTGLGGNVSILINDGDGTFAANVDYAVGSLPTYIAVGDLNNDGYEDVVAANYGDDNMSVLINAGNGTFGAATNYAAEDQPYGANIGDVNNDGWTDIVIANGNTSLISLFINDGDGTFAAKANYTVGASPMGVALKDVNNDGYVDMEAVGYGPHNVSVFINQISENKIYGGLAMFGKLFPGQNAAFDLGSDEDRWKDLYLSSGSLHIGQNQANEGMISYDHSGEYLQIESANNLALQLSGKVGVGTINPRAKLDVLSTLGASPAASISATSSVASLVVDNTIGDLFTASSSGTTRLFITNQGNVALTSLNPVIYGTNTAGGLYINGPTCFSGDTPVNTPSGPKEIQKLKIGDLVTSYDVVKHQGLVSQITNLFSSSTSSYLLINNAIKVTSQHPFYTPSGWKKAQELTLEDQLFTLEGWITITNIQTINQPLTVYNLEVDGTHTYFAHNILVHNKVVSGSLILQHNGTTQNTRPVGIGTTSPGSYLGVAGNVAIGSTYSGSAATADGLIVQGRVGIGTTSPEDLLEIQGAQDTDAIITLDADQGDDAGDTWEIRSVASDNTLSFVNDSTELMNLAAGGHLQLDGTFNVSGVSGLAYNAISDATTTSHGLASDNDFYVEGDVEIDGTLYTDGNLIAPATGISGYWQRANGAVAPTNITDDVLVGATATASAKIALQLVWAAGAISDGYVVGGRFVDNANSAYYVDPANTSISMVAAGNVGVGITPTSKLHVSSDFTGWLSTLANTGTTIGKDGLLISTNADGALALKIYDDYANNDLFSVSTASISANVPASFNAQGDVTIGNDMLFSNLDASYIRSNSHLYIQAGSPNENENLYLQSAGGGDVVIGTQSAYFKANGDIDFKDVSQNSRFFMNGLSGNVGIGTTSPVTKLDVSNLASGNLVTFFGYNTYGTANTESSSIQLGRSSTKPMGEVRAGNVNSADFSQGYLSFLTRKSETMTEALRIDQNGNVGIGTTAPTTNLAVTGSTYISGDLSVASRSAVASTSNNMNIAPNPGFEVNKGSTTVTNVDNWTYTATAGNGTAAITRVTEDASEGVYSLKSVLTGTTSYTIATETDRIPVSPSTSYTLSVDVKGNYASGFYSRAMWYDRWGNAASTSYNDAVSNGATTASWVTYSGTVTSPANAYTAKIQIYNYQIASTRYFDNVSFRQTSFPGAINFAVNSGNVGIGTTSPSALLHVNSTSTADDVVLAKFWSALDGDGEFNSIRVGKADAAGQQAIFGYRYDTTAGDEGAFITNYGDAVTSLYVRKGGNVGIGTTAPAQKLEVNGNQRFTTDSPIIQSKDGALYVKSYEATEGGLVIAAGNSAATYGQLISTYGDTWGTKQLSIYQNNTAGYMNCNGACIIDGSSHGSDLGEKYEMPQAIIKGSLVSVVNNEIVPTTKNQDNKIIGIISTQPGITLDLQQGVGMGTDIDEAAKKTSKIIALTGRVPTIVISTDDVINSGDPITSSSLSGIGMKAIQPGAIAGKALTGTENWNEQNCPSVSSINTINWPDDDGSNSTKPCFRLPDDNYVGKIMVFVNLSWYDPDVYLTQSGDIQIQGAAYNGVLEKDQIRQISPIGLISAAGEIINRIGAFSQIVAGKIRAGLVDTTNLVAENLVATRAVLSNLSVLGDLNVSGKLVSPLVQTENLVAQVTQTNLIKPMSNSNLAIELSQNSKFKIQDSTGNELVSINASGDATFAGTLAAQEITADSGHFKRLFADQIEGLSAQIATVAASTFNALAAPFASSQGETSLPETATESALLANLNSWSASPSGSSLNLTSLDAAMITASDFLAVLGQATINNLEVANNFTVNNKLLITQNSLGMVGENETLYFQPSGLGRIDMMAGKVTIDNLGNVSILGNLYVAQKTTTKDLEVTKEATVAGKLSAQKIIIAQPLEATPSGFGEMLPEAATNATAGQAILPAGTNEYTIYNSNLTANSLVYLTPTSDTLNRVLYLKNKTASFFTVAIIQPINQDIKFNWWVIN